MKKYKDFITNIIVFAIGGIGTKVVLFLLVPLYTHYLSPSEYGISELVFTVSQFIIPIVTITIYDAVTRFGVSINEDRKNVLLSSLIIWIAGSVILVLLSPLIALYSAIADWKWYLVAYVVLNGGLQIGLNYLKVLDKNKSYSIISILNSVFLALLNLLLIVVLKTGIRGYLLSNIGATLISFIFVFKVGRVGNELSQAHFDRELTKRMAVYSTPLVLNNISWWAIHSTDKIMINWLVSASALGIYTVSSKIPSMLNVFTGFFSQAWGLSSIREIETTNDSTFYSNVFKAYTGITFSLCVLMNSIIKPFMSVYASHEYAGAWIFVPVLLAAASFNAISSFFGTLYSAMKKTFDNMLTTIIAAVVNIVANYIFITMIGTMGAAIGTFLSYFVVAYIRLFHVKKYIPMEIDWKRHVSSVIIVIVQMVCVVLEFYLIAVSIASIILLVSLNYSVIKKLFSSVRNKQ